MSEPRMDIAEIVGLLVVASGAIGGWALLRATVQDLTRRVVRLESDHEEREDEMQEFRALVRQLAEVERAQSIVTRMQEQDRIKLEQLTEYHRKRELNDAKVEGYRSGVAETLERLDTRVGEILTKLGRNPE